MHVFSCKIKQVNDSKADIFFALFRYNFCKPSSSIVSFNQLFCAQCFLPFCAQFVYLLSMLLICFWKVRRWISCPDKYMLVASVGPWRHNKWAALSTPFSAPHTHSQVQDMKMSPEKCENITFPPSLSFTNFSLGTRLLPYEYTTLTIPHGVKTLLELMKHLHWFPPFHICFILAKHHISFSSIFNLILVEKFWNKLMKVLLFFMHQTVSSIYK